jgi:hypothetical protein
MFREEKQFTFRFSLEAEFPEEYNGEQDNFGWLQEWERSMKPELLKLIFESLRRHPSWTPHVRNRGLSPDDEIEIAMVKDVAESRSRQG